MATITQVLIYSLLGGLVSLLGGILMLSNKKLASALQAYGMPFAAGALLAAVFLDLLKDGLEESTAEIVLTSALIGIFVFFFAERFLRWFHHHHHHGKKDPSIALIITGDIAHNLLDGVAIAAAFLVSVPTGIVTTLAVAAHEIPQEIGDFGLLLAKGMRRKYVLIVNAISALATTFAALLTFTLGRNTDLPVGILLGISAGFLLYIAMSDIIPTIHERSNNKRLLDFQPVLMVLGALLVASAIQIAHGYIDADHQDHSDEHSKSQQHNDHNDNHQDDHHDQKDD
jgi:zinc and cadmium transporter